LKIKVNFLVKSKRLYQDINNEKGLSVGTPQTQSAIARFLFLK